MSMMQPQPPPPSVPTTTVYVQPAAGQNTTYPGYQGRQSKILGIIQIVFGVFSIICHGVLLEIGSAGAYSGAGIWGGFMVRNNIKTYYD